MAQRVGLSIREITDIFSALPPHPTPDDWGVVCRTLVSEAELRVADLRAQLDVLGGGGKLCELDTSTAPTGQRPVPPAPAC